MKIQRLAPLALLTVAIGSGASFVLMKDSIKTQPITDFLGTRFIIATLAMILIRPSVLKLIRGQLLRYGVILGVLLGGGYWTQTIGLSMTTAAITGFITGLYVIFTPLLGYLFLKQKLKRKVFIGALLALASLAFIAYNGVSTEVGQLWVIACALLFAAHIVYLSRWSPGQDPYALTVVQLGTMAVFFSLVAIIDGYQAPVGFSGWFTIVFTALVGTSLAFLVQTWAQSIMEASRTAIYLTSETVWTAFIAVAVGQEVLGWRTIIGGILMVAAMVTVEW